MRDKNNNNISGNVFNGTTNIIAGNSNNIGINEEEKTAKYTAEPVWRSPITMALLTWLGIIISLIEVFPIYKIFNSIITILKEKNTQNNISYIKYSMIFIILIFILIVILWLRSITKRETRHPLFFNYAINGFGRKISIEKIHINNCPKCGGKMKYYNKPVEWNEYCYNGKIKREITKRVPVLECKRNSEHCYEVDPAEDKLK
ncbi:hypothetical protein [Parvimonas sp. D9]|uniref:hypothetical protein n=1 Tax=Parvimonas sp. D9 TaxID=3110689 RepID=UPI002B496852|nr:hypothetical protein [Parvimonas sp. D9]MEB3059063.1 hypothetical protein [Parvimonas sp. D9]